MIINIHNAIAHVLDAESGHAFFSHESLDVSDATLLAFLCKHIEKLIDDASLRTATFKQSSGFKYQLLQYIENKANFTQFSKNICEKLYESACEAEKKEAFDIIVCECSAHEHRYIAILKCNNRQAVTHTVIPVNDGYSINISNDACILPGQSNKLSECAFIDLNDLSIKYKGKRITIDGETHDFFADVILECEYEFSTKESYRQVEKIAKAVATELAQDTIATQSQIKTFVKDTPAEKKEIVIEEVAAAAFPNAPAARNEFIEKIHEADLPPVIERHPYVEKAARSNMKLVTDTGIEVSFPAEFYRDNKNLSIITKEDGTLEINISNITEIVNK